MVTEIKIPVRLVAAEVAAHATHTVGQGMLHVALDVARIVDIRVVVDLLHPPPPPPTATPTPTPTPKPADFDVTSFYLTNEAGNRHYNYDETDDIFWSIQTLNKGESNPVTSNGRVYMNLYENQQSTVAFTSAHTNTYIDTTTSWSPNSTRTHESFPGGAREAEFKGPEGQAFRRTGADANNGQPLYARVFVDPGDQADESPGQEQGDNQAVFRYVIGDPPDLQVESFQLTDSNGVVKTQFSPGQRIYPKITIQNTGGSTAINRDPNDPHTYTHFYRNQDLTAPKDLETDINVILRSGEFDKNEDASYYCVPSPGNLCSRYTNSEYWIFVDNGRYTARSFVNFNNDNIESNYNNNQATVAYSVGYIIGGNVYLDTTKNGVKNSNDPPYPGMALQLYRKAANGQYTTRIGSRTTDANGAFEFDAMEANDYWLYIDPSDLPPHYKIYSAEEYFTTLPPNKTNHVFLIAEDYHITGRLYADMDQSGSYNAAVDFPLENITVRATGPFTKEAVTASDGRFTISDLSPGDYTVTHVTPLTDYNALTTLPLEITITTDDVNRNMRFFPKYSISGNVFIDDDDSQSKNGTEQNYAADPGITVVSPGGIPTPIVTNNTDGSYLITGLISQTYTVQYPANSLPAGYVLNHPVNGPPASFSAPVGSGCTPASPTPGGTCSNGSLQSLDFAIKGGQPWWQAYGLDVRFDNGLNNPIPPSPNAACSGAYGMLPASSTTNGIVFNGDSPADFWRGTAAADPYNWVVGGLNYPDTFAPTSGNVKTSYAYLQSVISQSSIPTTNLASVCTLSNCTLPGTLANGVYVASGNVTLNNYTAGANRDIVLLINGNLTINGTLRVPTTSTVFYSASGNITVNPTIGTVTAACPAPATGSGDIEGFFSADGSFTAASSANCSAATPVSDRQLNIQGAVVVNASGNGGSLTNSRTLCASNITYPTFTIKERPDFILNAPEILKIPSYIWQEVAP